MRKTGLRRRAWRSFFGLLLLSAAVQSSNTDTVPVGFSDVAIDRPDGRPWNGAAGFAFAADGRIFVWERGGRVWQITSGAPTAEPVIDLADEISTIGTLGLTGFALDPQFEQNGLIYLLYAIEPDHLANCNTPLSGTPACRSGYNMGAHASSGATIARLVRYQLVRPAHDRDFRQASVANPATRRVLLGESDPAANSAPACIVTDTAHGPGGLAFGTDGTLLVGCGDGGSAASQDSGSDPGTQWWQALGSGLMTPTENIGAFRAQLPASLSGKILRLDPVSGDGIASNPFYDSGAPRAARSRVWAMGLHDPQHLSIRPGTGSSRPSDGEPGSLYIAEVGSLAWESLAVARVGGANFGWPLFEGVGNDMTPFAANAPLNLEIAARTRPAIDWSHAGARARMTVPDSGGEAFVLMSSTQTESGAPVKGSPFGGTASVGGAWYAGVDYPPAFRNVYFHADTGGQWIKAFAFDRDDNPLGARDFVTSGGAIRAVAAAPRAGGVYYIAGKSGSEVRRIFYSSSSGTGRAAIDADSTPAKANIAPVPALRQRATSYPHTRPAASDMRRGAIVRPAPASGPLPWSNQDIGTVGAAGSFSVNGSTFSVSGSGSDIWNKADAFQFVSQPLSGDGSITARVVSQTNTNGWAKAGVMFRETMSASSAYAAMEVTPAQGTSLQARSSTGATAVSVLGPFRSAPYWVRVVRAGNVFTAYASSNGLSWTTVGQYTIPMAVQVFVGLAVCSHLNGALSTAVFDNVTVTSSSPPPPPDTQAPTVPTGLATSNVATGSLTLSWTASTDLPNPGGAGVGGYFIYRNGNTTTPIATISSGTTFNDSGLTAGTTYTYQVAAFDLASAPNVSAPSAPISVKTQSTVAQPWNNQDIGAVGAPGSYSITNGVITVKGSGADIWNKADAFQYVFQSLSASGSITARVVSQTNTNGWAKAGVMFRETLSAGASYVAMEITPTQGTSLQARTSTNAAAVSSLGPFKAAPYWVRVSRNGNLFTAYTSANGASWTTVGQYTVGMASQVFVGLAVCSHANGSLSTVAFDNVTVTSAAPPPPDTQAPTVPTGLATSNVTTSTLTLSWSASTDLPNPGGSGIGGYYVYRNGNTSAPIATVTSGTTFGDTGLSAGTTYTYQVAAFDLASPANVSAPSNAISVTTGSPDTQAPTVPTGLATGTITINSISLSWNASTDLPNPGGSGVGGYYIYRNGNTTPLATVTSGTTFTDSNLAAGTTYTYQVAAFDLAVPANVSVQSSQISGTTLPPDTQAPTVPGGLATTGVTAGSITLNWNSSTDLPNPGGSGVGGYYVYRNGNTSVPIATVTNGTAYTDSGLSASTAYTYQVAAFDQATPPNVSFPSAIVSATTQSVVDSTQISNLVVNNGGQTTYVVCGPGASCGVGFGSGVSQYVDSSAIAIGAPVPALVDGQTFIRTALGDSSTNSGSGNFMSFTLGQSATVYVAHDVQATVPAWLSANFMDTRLTLTNTNGNPGGTFEIYSNIYPTGAQVQLGSNTVAGATSPNMYSVIVAPTTVNTNGPGVPANLSPIPNCQTAAVVGLTWGTAAVGSGGLALAGYRIARNGQVIATIPYSQTSYQDTAVAQATTYNYSVAAFDLAGNVSTPATVSVTTNSTSPSGDAPYCPSTLITGMSFNYIAGFSDTKGNGNSSPTNLIDTPPYSDGSDLWALTQAADNSTYAFFGDGWGICGGSDTGSSETTDSTSFGFAKLTTLPSGTGCPAGASNVYGGYNSSRPNGGYSTCCTSNGGLILGKASAVVAIGNDFYALGTAWRSADVSNWINVKFGNHPPGRSAENHQEIISSTGPGNGAQQWIDSTTDLCNGTGTASNPVWGGALGVCPVGFVQFGPGYSGVPPDLAGYVYLYAVPTQWFLLSSGPVNTYLLRVPLTPSVQLLNPSAYQFFAGLDNNGNPIWTRNGSQKQIVFNDRIDQNYTYTSADGTACAGQTIAMSMGMGEAVYDKQLGRFIASAQGNYIGQAAFYEAPHPWGPWSVISYANLSMSNIFSSGWGAPSGGLGGGYCSSGHYINAISLGIHIANGWTDATGTVLEVVFSSSGEAPASASPLGGFNANPNGFGNSMDSFNVVPATLTVSQGSQ